jgi:hypothetical protein
LFFLSSWRSVLFSILVSFVVASGVFVASLALSSSCLSNSFSSFSSVLSSSLFILRSVRSIFLFCLISFFVGSGVVFFSGITGIVIGFSKLPRTIFSFWFIIGFSISVHVVVFILLGITLEIVGCSIVVGFNVSIGSILFSILVIRSV